LIFLRVVGAANFPIQARQRQGGPITVDFAVPSSRFGEVLLGPGAPLWDLCERGLSVSEPGVRPPAASWVAALEAVLDTLGASTIMRTVWVNQGGGQPSTALPLEPRSGPRDVVIQPVLASPRAVPKWTLVPPPPVAPWRRSAAVISPMMASTPASAGAGPGRWQTPAAPAGPGVPGVPGGTVMAAPPSGIGVGAQARAYLGQAVAWWVALHAATMHALWTSGQRREGARHLVLCAAVDFVAALVGLFVVAMIVAPVLGI
jgi:hypothetical protein